MISILWSAIHFGPMPPISLRGHEKPPSDTVIHRLLRIFVFAICLTAAGNPPAAEGVRVEISVQAGIEEEQLQISGEANVPDGAWIIYVAYRPANPRTRASGYAQVDDGRFAVQVDISNWPSCEIAVDVHFQVLLPDRMQPHSVIFRFGPKGERMIGDRVVEGGNAFRAAIASTTVVKP